jgi:plastocyanin
MPSIPAGKLAERLRRPCLVLIFFLSFGTARSATELAPVTAVVQIVTPSAENAGKPAVSVPDISDVVVWLMPFDRGAQPPTVVVTSGHAPQIIQRNKSFQPHILVVEVGTVVQFPNKDPFFHNIFSLFDGQRFDLGLYESGSSRAVRFDRAGASFLFCNIHPDMNAVIVAVDTPYFGLSDRSGHLAIPEVPDGSYEMHVWYERGLPDDLKGLNQRVVISESTRSLGTIHVLNNVNFTTAHENKYGQDYVSPPRPNYVRP